MKLIRQGSVSEAAIETKVSQMRDEAYKKLMVSTDFSKCKNSLQAVHKMFLSCWPTMHRLMCDNEILLADNAQVLKKFGDLDEAYKKLKIEHEKLQDTVRKYVQEAGKEES